MMKLKDVARILISEADIQQMTFAADFDRAKRQRISQEGQQKKHKISFKGKVKTNGR